MTEDGERVEERDLACSSLHDSTVNELVRQWQLHPVADVPQKIRINEAQPAGICACQLSRQHVEGRVVLLLEVVLNESYEGGEDGKLALAVAAGQGDHLVFVEKAVCKPLHQPPVSKIKRKGWKLCVLRVCVELTVCTHTLLLPFCYYVLFDLFCVLNLPLRIPQPTHSDLLQDEPELLQGYLASAGSVGVGEGLLNGGNVSRGRATQLGEDQGDVGMRELDIQGVGGS